MTDIFQKNSGKEIKVSLTTANKYMTKLKSHQSSEKEPTDPYAAAYGRRGRKNNASTVSATTDVSVIFNKYVAAEPFVLEELIPSIEKELAEHFTSIRDTFLKNRRIGWDISMIKNSIFATNGASGIDHILSKIDHLNSLKTDYQQLLKSLSGRTYALAYFNAHAKAVASGTTPSETTMDAWNKTELEQQIKTVNRQINELETQRDRLNASTDVTIHLSDESLEILGI